MGATGHPLWPEPERANVPQKRGSGLLGENPRESYNEVILRRLGSDATAAAVTAPAPAAAAPAPSTVAAPAKTPTAPTLPDRFHKWAQYVIVARDHNPGDDPIPAPGYSKANSVSSIKDGYDKAIELAAKSGKRCPLIVVGGGAPWTEPFQIHSDAVEMFGWGHPVILGNTPFNPEVTDVQIEDITFRADPNNNLSALALLPAPPNPQLGVLQVPQFRRCRFEGPQLAFYAQRRFVADDCEFVQTNPLDATVEAAPCRIEIEQGPQIWFSFLRKCRFYATLAKEDPQAGYPAPSTPVSAKWFALHATARFLGGPYVPTLLSNDGIFRASVNGATGTGVIESGVVLDDCDVYGQMLIEGWTVMSRMSRHYGPFAGPEIGGPAAVLRGHDWLAGADYRGRQFGIVMYDNCSVHASLIARADVDPLATDLPNFPGGAAVFFRNSPHLAHSVDAIAQAVLASVPTYFYHPGSLTSAINWGGANIIEPAGTGAGSFANIPAPAMFSPLYP